MVIKILLEHLSSVRLEKDVTYSQQVNLSNRAISPTGGYLTGLSHSLYHSLSLTFFIFSSFHCLSASLSHHLWLFWR